MTTRNIASKQDPGYPLIEPGDPAPFTVINPNGKAKVLLVADHASTAIPKAMNQLGLDDYVLDLHVASDIGSGDVTRRLSERLDAPAVLAGYSRLIIDCNRRTHDATAILEVSDGIGVPGNIELGEHEKSLRTESFFDPYHSAIAKELERFSKRGITPVFLSVHSCTPVFDRVVRPWHVGVLWDTDTRISAPFLESLNKLDGVCVGENEPYSGKHPHDYTVDAHAQDAGIPHVGIELRQDLIDTPAGANEWADILYEVLAPILADENLYQLLTR